jgi:hypothetical protein
MWREIMQNTSEPLNRGSHWSYSVTYANTSFRNELHSAHQTRFVLIGARPPGYDTRYYPSRNILHSHVQTKTFFCLELLGKTKKPLIQKSGYGSGILSIIRTVKMISPWGHGRFSFKFWGKERRLSLRTSGLVPLSLLFLSSSALSAF